jgi:hypothetical protein
MSTLGRATQAALAALIMVASLLVATPAFAAQGGCLPDVGKKVPVLFAHGLLGKAVDWKPFQDVVF